MKKGLIIAICSVVVVALIVVIVLVATTSSKNKLVCKGSSGNTEGEMTYTLDSNNKVLKYEVSTVSKITDDETKNMMCKANSDKWEEDTPGVRVRAYCDSAKENLYYDLEIDIEKYNKNITDESSKTVLENTDENGILDIDKVKETMKEKGYTCS